MQKHLSFPEMLKHLSFPVLFCLAVFAVISCKPSLPGDVISRGDMADILYDYHMARAILQQEGNRYDDYAIYEEIFRKHDVTRAEFDSSLVYYVRHYRLLQEVYSDVEGRLSQRAVAMGANVQDLNSIGAEFAEADTANIWKQEASLLLVPYSPYNVSQFDIKPDSTIQAGDRFLLSFDTGFIVQAGRRDLVAMLAIRFQNDSVAFSSQHISMPMHASITVNDSDRLGIKSISGFFTLASDPNDPVTTTKVAILTNIKLVHLHTEDPNKTNTTDNGIQEAPMDSTTRTAPDSFRRESVVLPETRMLSPQ